MTHLATVSACLWLLSCETAGIKRAYMALDTDGRRKRDAFYTDTEAIFCVAELASGREDLTVQGRLIASYLELPSGAVADRIVLGSNEIAPGAGEDLRVSFMLEKDRATDPYIAGQYECEIRLDGEIEAVLPFEIRFPLCPEAPLLTGFACAGHVREGSQCPGALSGTLCTCGTDGAWTCT